MRILRKRSVALVLSACIVLGSALVMLLREEETLTPATPEPPIAVTTPAPSPPPPSPPPLPTSTPGAQGEAGELLPLVLLESGYGLEWAFDSYSVIYGFVLYNPNVDYGVTSPSVRITARAADGSILGSQEIWTNQIRAGQRIADAGHGFRVYEVPTAVEFEIIPPREWNWRRARDMTPLAYIPLSVENISFPGGGSNARWVRVTGEVVNENAYHFQSGNIVFLFRDEDGEIIGGHSTFFSALAEHSRLPFDTSISGDRWSDNFEIHANPW